MFCRPRIELELEDRLSYDGTPNFYSQVIPTPALWSGEAKTIEIIKLAMALRAGKPLGQPLETMASGAAYIDVQR
jgi:hypothetical protein